MPNFIKKTFAALLCACASIAANASTIELLFSPSLTTASVGDLVTVDVLLDIDPTTQIDSVTFTLFANSPLSLQSFTFTPENAVSGGSPGSFFNPSFDPAFPIDAQMDFFAPFGTFLNTGVSSIGQLILSVDSTLPAGGAAAGATGSAVVVPQSFPMEFPFRVDISPQIMVSPVPLPAAAWLFGSGLLGLLTLRRRKLAANA